MKRYLLILLYSVFCASLIVFTYVIWKSFLNGWVPVHISFNSYHEGFIELCLATFSCCLMIYWLYRGGEGL